METISNFSPRGSLGFRPNDEGPVQISTQLDFSTEQTYVLDFGQLQLRRSFSAPRTLFVDNSGNGNPIHALVTLTGQEFPIPAFSAGYFPISAQTTSTIELYSLGDAGANSVHVELYNYVIPPSVWATNSAAPTPTFDARVQGEVNDGADVAGAPVAVAGLERATGKVRSLSTDGTGRVHVITTSETSPGTATTGNVNAATSSATLLAANSARRSATVYNDSVEALYLKYGASASATSFTVLIPAGGAYFLSDGYKGLIAGVWTGATGAARVTEVI